ncbi:unnamed protein product [Penicillium salamii]|nr:unnamed protein product [Penicillium salamii]CAG8354684.1 unnamed protein product [Penicillium salamii]
MDLDELRAKSSRYLLNYGTLFNKEVIGASKGLWVYKASGNGLPLSAVTMNAEIERVCPKRDYCFYTTQGNDPLPAAVGDKVLEIVVRNGLVAQLHVMGQILHDRLNA